MAKMTRCPVCGKVSKMTMYSNNWLTKWYTCPNNHKFKRPYTDEEIDRMIL